jgi:hypothetical protein
MTVQDLCVAILTTMNAIAPGETPAPEDLTLAQEFLNNLIGSWNAAVKKSLANRLAAFSKALAMALNDIEVALTDYDPSLYTFASTVLSATTLTFVPVAVTVNLADPVTFPTGWVRALTFNAAVDLLDSYGKPITPTLAKAASESKAEIITPVATPPPTS